MSYPKTHPWIQFHMDLQRLTPDTWMLLGETRSKCDHIAGVPLKPAVADSLHRLYLAKGAHATTAIEGNTLSEEDARKILDGRLSLPKSKQYMAVEIGNILRACQRILDECAAGESFDLSPSIIRRLNAEVLDGLDLDDHVEPGRFRRVVVGVSNYRAPEAPDVEELVERMCQWLNSPDFRRDDEWKIPLALLRAVTAHLYLAWIHPFGDGNGRTARLVEYAILVHAGVPSPAGHLPSNHYNETRSEYYRQLAYASASGGDVTRFLHYAVQGFVDGLHAQLHIIRHQQMSIAWSDYVHEHFRDRASVADLRQRDLVLVLAGRSQSVPREDLPMLSRDLFAQYRGKTDRTLARDLNALVGDGLIERDATGYRARTEIIQAFLPFRRTA